MKLFLDSANVDQIREVWELGILDGVTTNPTLVAQQGRAFLDVLKEILDIVDGPVNAEVVATEAEAMVEEGERLAELSKNVVVKIPMTKDGIKAVSLLSKRKIHTNVTLCFSAAQALLAGLAGATYVSPFMGRVDDIDWDGVELVADIAEVYHKQGIETQILAASCRHPLHVTQAAAAGADVVTMPYEVFEKLFHHPLTDIGLKRFLDDWEKAKAVLGGIQ
ncbi:MAG: fructose-6-phosphate aldolase [Firmicutes bacterium]|nr:fructose-6-phosphate aldolase [Bacillota bacterium]